MDIVLVLGRVGALLLVFGVLMTAGVFYARWRKRRTDAQWVIARKLLSADRWFTPKELASGDDGYVDPVQYDELQRMVQEGYVDTIHANSPQVMHRLSPVGAQRIKEERYR